MNSLKEYADRLRALIDIPAGFVIDGYKIPHDYLKGLVAYIDSLEAQSRGTEATPPPTEVGWNEVQVIGDTGHSYGVHMSKDGVLVIASKRSDRLEWAQGVKPQGDCWASILGGYTRYIIHLDAIKSPTG